MSGIEAITYMLLVAISVLIIVGGLIASWFHCRQRKAALEAELSVLKNLYPWDGK